jgi:hypothetical protein
MLPPAKTVPNSNGKTDYLINYNGNEYLLERVGDSTKFQYGTEIGQVKELKQMIVDGRFDEVAEEEEKPERLGTWDCVQAEALLILNTVGDFSQEVKNTLDCRGWLDENGQPDVERAMRELERINKLRGNS